MMKIILILIWVASCVKSDNKDASKYLQLNKTRFEKQIDMINSCLKKGGMSDAEIKTINSKEILESIQKEIPTSVCANFTTATPEQPAVRRCRYLLHPITTIELCLNDAQQHNVEFRAEVANLCRIIKQKLNDLSENELQELNSFPMYGWVKDRKCDDNNYDAVHASAGSGGQ